MRIQAVVLVLAISGCSSETTPGQDLWWNPGQDVTDQHIALTTFSGAAACADLERHLEDRAVQEMRIRVELNKRSAMMSWEWAHQQPGTGGGGGSILLADAGSAVGSAGGAAGGSSGTGGGTTSSAPTDFTQTNNQVVGIEEPDIIKNDGTRLFAVSGRRLFTVSTWPATSLATRGSVALEGRPMELLLRGDRVVVFSAGIEPSFGVPAWCRQSDCSSWYSNATIVSHVDVSDLANPVVLATQRIPGRYESARQVGTAVRLVTTSSVSTSETVNTWVDYTLVQEASSLAEVARLHEFLADSNEGQLRARTLSQWLPSAQLRAGGTSTTMQLACDEIAITNASAQLGLTNIVTLDLAEPTAFSRQGLLAAIDELYQGPDSLYLAQRHWWWWGASGSDADRTYVYRFDLSQADRVHFVAAGRLDGRPLNQFSFDEHAGVLRVATTVTGSQNNNWTRINRVVTLGAQGGVLTELGRTEDLAPGEQIMSARFIGDRAYVVTFRQVDPLYVIDLSDPAHPTKVGELKIPGFSSYLHPLDATHLLTIGTYVPEVPVTWNERHVQLQIFDVSDPAHPRQTHTQQVGRAWGWSEAQGNHKAFNYFAAKKLLAVPFSDWYQDANGAGWQFVSDLRVFHVDPTAGFTPRGTLAMDDLLRTDDCPSGCWSWYWQPMVRRSVMADDFVYAISTGGVRVAHVDALSTPLATAPFTPAP